MLADVRSLLRAVLLATCAVLAGCSRGPAPVETTASTTSSLSSTATQLVISVPNPLSPVAPVVGASGQVQIGFNDDIVGTTTSLGGGLSVQQGSVITGDAWSEGQALILDRSTIQGVLHASSALIGNQVTLGGRDTTPRFDPNSTLSWTVQFPSGQGPNYIINSGQSQTLAPGFYGLVQVNQQATLTLTSGTYYISLLALNLGSTLVLDQARGPIIIYASQPPVLNGSYVTEGGLLGGSDGGVASPDLLIAYLGNLAVIVNSTYSGALIAPFGQLILNPVSSPYVGFFYAGLVQVQQNTTVEYRLPTALVAASRPLGPVCLSLLSGVVPPVLLPVYCTSAQTTDDTDGDGVPDGVDECPYDSTKIVPGACGCGTPDIDSDGDGIPDCLKTCTNDPQNINPGQCGCVGTASLQPAGTFCSDTACPPQAGATCNGAGVCGNRAACQPSAGCIYVSNAGTSYWICGEQLPTVTELDGGHESTGSATGAATESAAQAACTAKGLTLLQVNSLDENRFIAQFLTTPIWLGANDITTSGTWDWSFPGSSNGVQFWSGGATGTRVNGLFSNWQPGSPGSNRCAVIQPSGYWVDVNCSDSFGYVCEYQPPPVQNGVVGPAGQPSQPANLGTQCVPEFNLDAGGLPDSLAQLQGQVDAAFADVFIGAAANPPPMNSTSTCPDDLDAASQNLGTGPDAGACWYVGSPLRITQVIPNAAPDGGALTLQTDCITDQDCVKQWGSGYYCRQIKDDTCIPPEAGSAPTEFDQDAACVGGAMCVQMQCPLPDGGSCQEIPICNPDASFDASPDPTTSLDAGAFNPAQMFEGGAPDGASAGFYFDPAEGGVGPLHPWCTMRPQNPVPTATQPNQNTQGSSGSHSPISFSFDPNLEFTANVNPTGFGQGGLAVHGGATLKASVSLNNFFGQNYTADIVDIGAGIDATQCNVNNDKTQFTVLGVDIISLTGLGVPRFDSAELDPNLTRDCNDAVANFTLWSNRVKKAFRDGQQLLSQYQAITSNGGQLASTLCPDIIGPVAANAIPNFPGGLDCPTAEPVEITINRFVQYLQAPGIGQVSQLRGSAMQLVTKSQGIINSVLDPLKQSQQFLHISEDESQTVLSIPFAIGPVPMLLQIDVYASYGIAGSFNLTFNVPLNKLFGLDDTFQVSNPNTGWPGEQIPIAHAGVQVMPYAGAGLSAFVGAGFDFGALSAAVGIDGAVNLGDVAAPVYAGAGVEVLAQYDPRPVPSDIAPPVSVADLSSANPVGSLFQFSLPKAFQFFVWFDYGAGIELDNVLSGDIAVQLRIKFFFFSRTWSKTLVHFNGWSKHFDLVSGAFGAGTGGAHGITYSDAGPVLSNGHQQQRTSEVTGTPTMGLAESQLPLTVLQTLTPPDGGISATAGLDAGDGGDSGLALLGQTIAFDASMVQGFFYDDLCCIKQAGQACSLVGTPACCPDYQCTLTNPSDRDSGTCQIQCVADGGACRSGTAAGCCGSLMCQDGVCAPPPPPPPCNGQDGPCGPTQSCCGGLECSIASGSSVGVCTLNIQ
ncbi:MAG: C-type lectin domain-containing protein [Polyangiaceae bacterium]